MEENFFNSRVKYFENGLRSEIPYLYLDKNHKVTVGTGLMFLNSNELIQAHLDFVVRGTDKPATNEQIKNAFDAVASCPIYRIPEKYINVVNNNITAKISRLTSLYTKRMGIAEDKAREWFTHDIKDDDPYKTFDSLPEDVRYALKEMAYNMGNSYVDQRGLAQFTDLRRALHNGDFATAAKESHRKDVNAERNQTIYDWIYQYKDTVINKPKLP